MHIYVEWAIIEINYFCFFPRKLRQRTNSLRKFERNQRSINSVACFQTLGKLTLPPILGSVPDMSFCRKEILLSTPAFLLLILLPSNHLSNPNKKKREMDGWVFFRSLCEGQRENEPSTLRGFFPPAIFHRFFTIHRSIIRTSQFSLYDKINISPWKNRSNLTLVLLILHLFI